MVLLLPARQIHCHLLTPGSRAVRFLQQQRQLFRMAAAASPAQQSSSRPKVAVGQMTAVGDQLTNFNTCSKLAEVRVLSEDEHAIRLMLCTTP